MQRLLDLVKRARRVYIIGNGGSGANASHIVNDLLNCEIKAFDINQPFFSATANDRGYDQSFARWIRIVGEPGDLLIALSGSGKSPNILAAVKVARDKGMDAHLITDELYSLDMQASEEAQLRIGHSLMRELKA